MSAEPLSSACIYKFWFTRDVSGMGVVASPIANKKAQVRLRVNKTTCKLTFRLKKIADADVAAKKRKYSRNKAKTSIESDSQLCSPV